MAMEIKKSILIFVFVLNALIMTVMGIIIWGEILFIADRVVNFCRFVFIVNSIVCAVYSIIILLLSIRLVLDHGSRWLNRGETEYEYTITREGGIESDKDMVRREVKILDLIKDYGVPILLLFSFIFLAVIIVNKIWYIMN